MILIVFFRFLYLQKLVGVFATIFARYIQYKQFHSSSILHISTNLPYHHTCVCVCVWQANYHVLLYHFLNFTIITHTLNVLLVLVWLREHRCCCFVSHNNCNNVQL